MQVPVPASGPSPTPSPSASPSPGASPGEDGQRQRRWRALSAIQRRVAGVLVEKAKTTPDQYPLSLNGLTSGCNQKTNREPQLNLTSEQIETALEELREMGAVIEVQGGGRVPKYRHSMYEWLGVDKIEMAVITELLLRGEQTVGELRGRAARMEPIADLNALRPVVQSLVDKGLVIELTPEGRGQVVTHALYKDRELNELRTRFAGAASVPSWEGAEHEPTVPRSAPAAPSLHPIEQAIAELRDQLSELRGGLDELRDQVRRLRSG